MDRYPTDIRRRALIGLFAASGLTVATGQALAGALPPITVWKDPSCGCCTGWVDHLRRNGFEATVIEIGDLQAIKTQGLVPQALASCHTAEIAGYTVEGHVPARAMIRLLTEKPLARGLAVPGMPMGSPGMEGGKPEAFDVILFGDRPPTPFDRYLNDQRI